MECSKGGSQNLQIRKYLVLLQDCLAIKFVSINETDGKPRGPASSDSTATTSTPQSSTKTDQSLKGLFLYKEFKEANLPCYWNSGLQETFEKLEYKGTIVPSTILVGSSIRRHLTMLKTAWAQKMLKSPAGYRIQFAGEIEELIADPIEKSHFIPLSESICWAIHELSSSGQEAFVDGILGELGSTFPDSVLPPKELIYQVLERLTKSKKVYQTAQGYFLVTPDTNRYISNTDPLSIQQLCLQNNERPRFPTSISECPDRDSEDTDADLDFYSYAKVDEGVTQNSTLRRSNSLRNSIKKYERMSGCLPRRTFSMKSAKHARVSSREVREHCPQPMLKVSGSRLSLKESVVQISDANGNKDDPVLDRRRKHKSFLKNLLTFRRSTNPKKSRNATSKQKQSKQDQPQKQTLAISTQTSNSIENLHSNFRLLTVSTTTNNPCNPVSNTHSFSSDSPSLNSSPRKSDREQDSDSGRFTESSDLGDLNKEGGTSFSMTLTPPSRSRSEEDIKAPSMSMSPSPDLPSTPETPDAITFHTRPSNDSPQSSSSLFNNPYRRKYGHPHPHQSQTLPRSLTLRQMKPPLPFKYPPRPFEKKQIYEKLSKPAITSDCQNICSRNSTNNSHDSGKKLTISASTSMSVSTSSGSDLRRDSVKFDTDTNKVTGTVQTNPSNSNVELELLLPLGKLISKVLTDFEQNGNSPIVGVNENENESIEKNKGKCSNEKQNWCDNESEDRLAGCVGSGGKEEARGEERVISKTVNDLFTIKNFVKTTQDHPIQLFNSQVQFTTQFVSKPNNNFALNGQKKPGHVETVSFKPFAEFYDRGQCRESEII